MEGIVSIKLARLLWQKGFKEETFFFWHDLPIPFLSTKIPGTSKYLPIDSKDSYGYYAEHVLLAPGFLQAIKYFKKSHNLSEILINYVDKDQVKVRIVFCHRTKIKMLSTIVEMTGDSVEKAIDDLLIGHLS